MTNHCAIITIDIERDAAQPCPEVDDVIAAFDDLATRFEGSPVRFKIRVSQKVWT